MTRSAAHIAHRKVQRNTLNWVKHHRLLDEAVRAQRTIVEPWGVEVRHDGEKLAVFGFYGSLQDLDPWGALLDPWGFAQHTAAYVSVG